MADIRDLKKFPGNKLLGGEFMFFPIDRTKTVNDIPKLQPHEVKVCAIIHQGKKVDPKTGKRIVMAHPAYDQCIKASHLFNLLDARGVISVTERQAYIGRVRTLAKMCADAFVQTEAGGFLPKGALG